jgi:hypothetical protein
VAQRMSVFDKMNHPTNDIRPTDLMNRRKVRSQYAIYLNDGEIEPPITYDVDLLKLLTA